MKILKKLLLVGLFSFAFVVNASAETRDIQYQDTLKEWINENKQLLDNVAQYFKDNASIIDANHSSLVDITNDKNVLYYPNINFSNNQIIVGVLVNYETNSNYFQFYNNTSASLTFYYKEYVLNYDSSTNEILGISSFKTSNTSTQLSTYDNVVFNNKFFDWRLGKNTDTIIKNSSNYDFILNSNNDIFYNNTTFDGTFYNFVELLNYGLIADSPEENVCDRTAVLGAVSNVSEIKLNVKGDTSVFYPLKGTFTLSYNSDNAFTTDDFIVELINNSDISIFGNYNIKCPIDVYACYLNYEYSSMDDIIETIDFSFKIKLSNNNVISFIRLYACTSNDDYTNISYDYLNGPTDSTTNNPNTDNYLQDGNIIDSSNTVGGFFENFEDNDYGLSSIITIPLTSIQKLTNSSCSPISLPIPFINKNIDLPCMTSLYEQNIPLLLNIWQTVSFGIISYTIIVDIFGLVKKFKNPEDDKLEVMDL